MNLADLARGSPAWAGIAICAKYRPTDDAYFQLTDASTGFGRKAKAASGPCTRSTRYYLPVVEGAANGAVATQARRAVSAGRAFTVARRAYAPSTLGLAATLGLGAEAVSAEAPTARIADHRTGTSTETSSETVSITGDSRFEFENGFVDMADTTTDPNETWYWHFDSADAFDSASGTATGSSTSSPTTSRETSTSSSAGNAVSSTSVRSSFSEQVLPDAAASHESDLWGADFEVGCDLWRGERFSLGIGIGATFYRGEDDIRAAGRCYAATAETRREIASGRFATMTETTVETTTTTTEETTFTAQNLAYDGVLDDIKNDDGSIGGGTADGLTNPYGGNNPSMILSDGSVTTTTTTETGTDTMVKTTRTFEPTGSRSGGSSMRRMIDVAAEGDVETQELRAVLQPSWLAADWLEVRGSLGAVATRVDVDVDATVFVNGARFATISGDDDDWVFAGLCGLDAVFTPLDWLDLTLGGDVRFGDTEKAYRAGLVRGTVELARYTFRLGIGIRF